MDPNASALIMRDRSADKADRLEAAYALAGWISGGGFPQTMFDNEGKHVSFGGNTAARFAAAEECRSYIRRLG